MSQPPDRVLMICLRVDDHLVPAVLGSKKLQCDSCGTMCWVSPASHKQLLKLDARVWCTLCSSAKMSTAAEIGVLPISVEQLQEIRESQR